MSEVKEVYETKTVAEVEVKEEKPFVAEETTAPDQMMLGKYIGAHVSAAGGVFNSLINMKNINATSCAFFVKSQRKWTSADMPEEVAEKFRELAMEYKFDAKKHALVHGSYLINMANADQEKREQAYYCFLDDLKRCERLGVGHYNFHPGSTSSCTKEEGINNLAECINRAHEATKDVVIVTENMAGQGNCLGGNFSDFAALKAKIKNLDRWKVCLDTCHSFAAGYDLRTKESYEKVIEEFDKTVGVQYIGGWHLNDSKAPLKSNRDLHENIGLGFLGLEPFRLIMNDSRWDRIPMVLETPAKTPETWENELLILRTLVGKSADDSYVLGESKRLADMGETSRKDQLSKFEKKEAKQSEKKRKDETTTAQTTIKTVKRTRKTVQASES
ncbi:AP endonuclease Apn1 [Schizosaccharomyces cryophilus OY26]|uniref:Apurinic-apyrimidinic endonuclease 1 n=1 Tax=Schizosaccharomyces cryophilus (strain OY26 / ATCC MYA-4695 / CBS 11777 / NBRC 106824 / NRRL Y48691) TaxID=653667 RepID=S9X4V8_SCHCR|nr:AP endonuclease Apn1 [Schizosaccharomyces cryophilus OY26]EPY52117.1 AP endonuclease Apn1 [Schizosaccharomyces cryophilus OY26]